MRILIYDSNKSELKFFCEIIRQLPLKILVDKSTDYNMSINLIEKHTYDKIFVDYSNNFGKKLFEYVINKDSKQNIISMSKDTVSFDNYSCDFCKNNFNKRRLIKPIVYKDIILILANNYECENLCDDKLLLQLYQIKNLIKNHYVNYNFDIKNLIFVKDINIDFSQTGSILITEKLNYYGIKYSINYNEDIKILV